MAVRARSLKQSSNNYKCKIELNSGGSTSKRQLTNYSPNTIINLSSSEEEEEPRSSTSRNVANNQIVSVLPNTVGKYLDKNNSIVNDQVSKCEKDVNKVEEKCITKAAKIDKVYCHSAKPNTRNHNNKTENQQNTLIKRADEINKVKPTGDVQQRGLMNLLANPPKTRSEKYPSLIVGCALFFMKDNILKPWSECKLLSVTDKDMVYIESDDGEKISTLKELAYFSQYSIHFKISSRVIAKCHVHNNSFIAGVVAESPSTYNNYRYLIFFDNGLVEYRNLSDIRLVLHQSNQVWNDVHYDVKEFFKNYFEVYQFCSLPKLTIDSNIRAQYHNRWETAVVVGTDASLVELFFVDCQMFDWLYRGSLRIWNIYTRTQNLNNSDGVRQSRHAYLSEPMAEFSEPRNTAPKIKSILSYQENFSEKQDLININPPNSKPLKLLQDVLQPKKYTKHKCNNSCVKWTEFNFNEAKQINFLAIPLHFGFSRNLRQCNGSELRVFYITPCGIHIHNINEMLKYLVCTSSELTIDLFDFSSWVHPLSEFKELKYKTMLDDISCGKEFNEITCVNNINYKLPSPMNYITNRQATADVNLNLDSNFLCGCDCTDNCQDKSKCACWKMTFDMQKILPLRYIDPNIGYSHRRLPERVPTGIYECNKNCKCSSSCLNRVVQNPMIQKLQLFMTKKKGWGVRCLNDIPQGSFICVFVGSLLTETSATEIGKNYGDEYLADLDYIEIVEQIKQDYESDVPLSDQDIDDSVKNYLSETHSQSTSKGIRSSKRLRKRKKLKENETNKRSKHIVSKSNSRSKKKKKYHSKPIRECYGNNEGVCIIDARLSGNIGRYFNHSCTPNLFVQNVFVDTHDLRFPWVSFFAQHYIPAGTELTWDYNYEIGSVPGKEIKCLCESPNCKGRLI